MSMGLLWPAALWALAALLLPLLIHLTRRLERTRTPFAAMRWISATIRPRRRLRMQQWLLLLLRLLLLAVAALTLAQPYLRREQPLAPWFAVVPGIDAAALAQARSNAPAAATWVWLSAGFSAVDPSNSVQLPAPSASASLLRQLDQELPAGTPLSVLLPERWSGMDAERLRLSRAVDWQVLDSAADEHAVLEGSAPALELPADVSVYHDADGAGQLRFVKAAVAGWNAARSAGTTETSFRVLQSPDEPLPAQGVLVWLAAAPPPAHVMAWVEAGGTVLLDARTPMPDTAAKLPLARAADGATLASSWRVGRGRVTQLAQNLSLPGAAYLAEADFASRLLEWLRPPVQLSPAVADARAVAPKVDSSLQADPPPLSLHPHLALLLALLFLLERVCASWPGRRVS